MTTVNMNFFMNDLRTKDKIGVNQGLQIILGDQNRVPSEAMQAFNYVVSSDVFPELLDLFNSKEGELILDKSKWTTDYYYEKQVELTYNFCRERFEHQVAVRDHLAAQGHPNFVYIPPKSQPQSRPQSTRSEASEGYRQPLRANKNTSTDSKKKNSSTNIMLWVGGSVAFLLALLLLAKK